jgi:electron transfer flavoprotein beta subunit
MRILTLAIQVPDSRSAISVEPDGSGIKKAGVKFVCNPFDEFAVEQAIQLKEGRSDVEEVAVLTAGPADASGTLRTALAMGADRAVHVVDETPMRDELALAEILAAAINRDAADFDLIFCGKQTIARGAARLDTRGRDHEARRGRRRGQRACAPPHRGRRGGRRGVAARAADL